MFQKIQMWLKSKEEQVKKREELRKAQAYYRLVKAGNTFIAFVREDLKKNQDNVNRHMRRRLEKEIEEKGILSNELIQYYAQKIDFVLYNIQQRLNPPKPINNPNVK
jgi:predicted transcriptional regulator